MTDNQYWNGYCWKQKPVASEEVEPGTMYMISTDPAADPPVVVAKFESGGFVCTSDSIKESPEPLSLACPAECGHTWAEPDKDDVILTPDHRMELESSSDEACPGVGEPAVIL